MSFGGILQDGKFDPPSSASNEGRLFLALYNCLYSCCWLIGAMLDFDISLQTHPHRRGAARRSSPRPRKDLGRSRGRQRIEGVEAIAEQFTAR